MVHSRHSKQCVERATNIFETMKNIKFGLLLRSATAAVTAAVTNIPIQTQLSHY
jgi:hypothetical protein